MATTSQKKEDTIKIDIDKLEVIHRRDLDDFYSLYEILRDLYKHISKTHKTNQQTFIAKQVVIKVGNEVYNRYKSKISQGLNILNKVLNYRKIYKFYPDYKTNQSIVTILNSNKEFFNRLIVILNDIFISNQLSSLIKEIELEKKGQQ